MTRLKPGFHGSNGEFVTADARVEYRFGARHGTVNAIFQDGEAEMIFDDNGDICDSDKRAKPASSRMVRRATRVGRLS